VKASELLEKSKHRAEMPQCPKCKKAVENLAMVPVVVPISPNANAALMDMEVQLFVECHGERWEIDADYNPVKA
jgi:hypothetical protein